MNQSALKTDYITDINQQAVGTILGKGGDNIKKLQAKYGKECRVIYNKQQMRFEIYARSIDICAQVKSALYREETQWKLQRRSQQQQKQQQQPLETNTQHKGGKVYLQQREDTTQVASRGSKEWSMAEQEFPDMGSKPSIPTTNSKWGASLDNVRVSTPLPTTPTAKPIPYTKKKGSQKNRRKDQGSTGSILPPFNWNTNGASDTGVYA